MNNLTALQHSFRFLSCIEDEYQIIDVLAVSGLGSHPFGSFVHKESGNMWLIDNLPRDIPAVRVMTYGYETGLQQSTSFVQIPELSGTLRTATDQILRPGKERFLVIIGHSLGGLLVKEALIGLDDDVLDKIIGILLFGAPKDGMDIKSLVPIVRDQPNRSLTESLNSMKLQSLRQQE